MDNCRKNAERKNMRMIYDLWRTTNFKRKLQIQSKLADTSKILRKLVDKQLLILGAIGKGMKFYINKNFDNTDGIVPSETVGIPSETNRKPLEQEIIILDYLKELDKRLINKLGSGRNTYYGVNNDW